MSFGVSELTRGGRSAWRRARKESCDSGGCCDESIGLCGDVVIESAGLDAGGGSRRDGFKECHRFLWEVFTSFLMVFWRRKC